MANLFELPQYIAVEGPIRVGKSTLARILAERLNAQQVVEPDDNPFLKAFYDGEPGTAFQAQFAFLARRFEQLPYVAAKGSFRFDLCGLARQRFDQVHDFALHAQALLPGAPRWLETHRHHLGNKYFASKFYLLAIVLPWLISRTKAAFADGYCARSQT